MARFGTGGGTSRQGDERGDRQGVRVEAGAAARRTGRAIVVVAIAVSVAAVDAGVGRAEEPTPPSDPATASASASDEAPASASDEVDVDAGLGGDEAGHANETSDADETVDRDGDGHPDKTGDSDETGDPDKTGATDETVDVDGDHPGDPDEACDADGDAALAAAGAVEVEADPVGTADGTGAVDLTRGVVPVGGCEVFVGDWETGDFSQWEVCQSTVLNGDCASVGRGDDAMAIVDAPDVRRGHHAARFTVRPGDVPEFGGGERSEVQSNAEGALVQEGDERWYEWSVWYPEDLPDVVGRFFITLQWHSSQGPPPLAIDLSRGSVDIGGEGVPSAPRRTIGPIRRGEWVDYVMRVKFSQDPDTGFVEAWENGERTVERTNRATMNDGENYLKQGIYRSTTAEGTVSLTQDELRVTAP